MKVESRYLMINLTLFIQSNKLKVNQKKQVKDRQTTAYPTLVSRGHPFFSDIL